MPTGTITRFFKQQGYGYITPDDNDGDFVVMIDDVVCEQLLDVAEGTRVRFEEDKTAVDLRARNVSILAPSANPTLRDVRSI